MKAIRPPRTPRGLAFTPGYALNPGARIIPLGVVTPERDGAVNPSIAQQTADCLANVDDMLARLGNSARAVKMTLCMTDVREVWDSNAVFDKHYASDERPNPAKTLLEVSACSVPGARFEVDVWAVVEPDGGSVTRAGDVRVAHGQAGEAAGAGLEAELESCVNAIDQALAASRDDRAQVARLAVHLADMSDWSLCRQILERQFDPAQTVLVPLAVTKVGQVGARVELSAWTEGPAQPANAGDPTILAISGSAAIPMYIGGEASDLYKYRPVADIRDQVEVCLNNYANILQTAGSSWDDIFETTWHLTDRREWDAVAEVVEKWFGRPVPNPTVIEVPKFVLPGVRVEIDMWGTIPAGGTA